MLNPTLIAAVGIFLTTAGAWCVAYEVVNKFTGKSHRVSVGWGGVGGEGVEKTEAYVVWESSRNTVMWIGLALITIGGVLQMAALFMPAST